MSKIRFKIEVHAIVDTEDYPIPADGRLALQLKEDLEEAIERNMNIEINAINVKKVSIKNDEEYTDYSEQG